MDYNIFPAPWLVAIFAAPVDDSYAPVPLLVAMPRAPVPWHVVALCAPLCWPTAEPLTPTHWPIDALDVLVAALDTPVA